MLQGVHESVMMYMIDLHRESRCRPRHAHNGGPKMRHCEMQDRHVTTEGSPPYIPRRSEDTAAVGGCTAAQRPTETSARA